MNKSELLYAGKAKSIFKTHDDNFLIMEYRDDASAFNGVKVAKLANKGKVNNYFNAHIMQLLNQAGIPTHFEKLLNDKQSLVKNLKMLPVECVIRNVAAGGICKRLGLEEGMVFAEPIFEFFYKNDGLGDPMVNESHIIVFAWANQAQIDTMKNLSLKINKILKETFKEAGIILVDYKLEFGIDNGELYLGDEFSPDGCRLWDGETKEKLDKDRFRQDLGDVVQAYQIVAKRLGITIPN